MGQDRSVQKERIMKANTGSIATSNKENHPHNAPRPCRCVRQAGAARCPACLGRPLQVALAGGNGLSSERGRRSLEKQARCWTWHFFASDGHALDNIVHTAPDVLVLWASLPEVCSLRAARQLRAHLPELHVLMLSSPTEKSGVLQAIQDGATGFLELPLSPAELACGLRDLAKGRTVLCANAQAAVVEYFQGVGRARPLLSPREQQVMKGLADGLCEAEVGERLKIQTSTVHTLVGRIYEKWHVHTRSEALEVFHRLP